MRDQSRDYELSQNSRWFNIFSCISSNSVRQASPTHANNCHYYSISFPSDTRSIPFAVACLVFGFQLLRAMVLCSMSYHATTNHTSKPTAKGSEREREGSTHNADFFSKFRQHVSGYGGYQIFGFMVARFAGCFALLLLSGIGLRACEVDLRCEWKGFLTSCPEIYMVATYVGPTRSFTVSR